MKNEKNITKERMMELIKEINKHDELYDKAQQIISDSEYDDLYFELMDIEMAHPEWVIEDSPTQKITSVLVEGLTPYIHKKPMLSLDKTKVKEGVYRLLDFNEELIGQYKLDGLTIVITYEQGKLALAVTRGSNGIKGEIVTHTVSTIKNLPKRINFKEKLVLRAEVVIPYAEFDKANTDGKYSNCRNLASGTVRQLDSQVAASRGLKAIIFDVIEGLEGRFEKDSDQIEFIKSLGFEYVETTIFNHLDKDKATQSISKYIDHIEKTLRSKLEFMIDGIVFKVNNLSKRDALGQTSKYPKWAIAFKFKSMDENTVINNVIHQIGKTGVITPVAILDKIEIDNVSVERATLHNYKYIKDLDIKLGDTVTVIRANDVIPKVTKVYPDLRKGSESEIKTPSVCPVCGTPTLFKGEYLYCPNGACKGRDLAKVIHYASKDGMNISGFGKKGIELFIEKGLITSVLDIYSIPSKKEIICNLEHYGEKKFNNLIKSIEASKSNSQAQLLYALAIELVGHTASKNIIKKYTSVQSLMDRQKAGTLKDDLLAIDGIGEAIATNMTNYFSNAHNLTFLEALKKCGVQLDVDKSISSSNTPAATSEKLKGLIFVATGSFEHYQNREAINEAIEINGGKAGKSVSSKTNYLINNDILSKSGKNKKALELGIPIISEEEFIKMITE